MTRKNFSEKREAIYRLIKNSKEHPSAEWVYNQLKVDYPNISLGTVYRNITMFVEQGMLNSICTVNGRERFDADTSPHTHFICECCGSVFDIETLFYDKELDVSVENDTGYKVKNHGLFFYGKCDKCSRKDI